MLIFNFLIFLSTLEDFLSPTVGLEISNQIPRKDRSLIGYLNGHGHHGHNGNHENHIEV